MSAPRAALTGFAPFGRWSVNSSGEAVGLIAPLAGLTVGVLPVDHHAAPKALSALVGAGPLDVLLLTGLAEEPRLRLELRARRPDHVNEGPEGLRGLWPWAAALDAMRAAGLPARLSEDPGRFVCETTYWAALSAGHSRLTAFLHVPPLGPDWPAGRVAAGVSACLGAGLAAAGAREAAHGLAG